MFSTIVVVATSCTGDVTQGRAQELTEGMLYRRGAARADPGICVTPGLQHYVAVSVSVSVSVKTVSVPAVAGACSEAVARQAQ